MTSPTTWPSFRRDLVAILRGIKPDETHEIISALVEAGFEAIEIPLNSPDPFSSIRIAADTAPDPVLIGAGTVLTTEAVDQLADSGGRLMVSPNVDTEVLRHAGAKGMITMPGVFTASEALLACKTGATALKFFPASVPGPSGISAIRAVLPPDMIIGAVGGVSDDDFAAYSKVGIRTFGLGSCLYKPGMSVEEISARAKRIIAAYDEVFSPHQS